MFRIMGVLLAALAIPCSAARPTTQPKTRPVSYDKWGFSVSVPLTSVKQMLPSESTVQLWELFTFGDLLYSVTVTRTPAETLTSTAIEKAIQAQFAAASSLGGGRRWELDAPSGELFKGLAGPLSPSETSPEAPYLKKSLGKRQAFRSLCMAPLGDESSPIITLSVTGSKTRSAEIEDLCKFFAFGFSRGAKPGEPVLIPAAPTQPPKLKKGDIELVGSVESVEGGNQNLTMIVDRIKMPDAGYIKLDPPRRKVVLFDTLPAGVVVNSAIRVIGFNTGVGQPITADVIVPDKP